MTASPGQAIPVLSPLLFMCVGYPHIPKIKELNRDNGFDHTCVNYALLSNCSDPLLMRQSVEAAASGQQSTLCSIFHISFQEYYFH